MNASVAQLAFIAGLLLINALLSGSEIALITLRSGQVDRLEEDGSRAGRAVARLANDPNRFLATIQIGITLSGFLASATAAVTLAEPLVEPLRTTLGAAAWPVAVGAVTLVLTFVTLVFAELVPKRIAMRRAERWALMAARPLDLGATLARPLVAVLSWSTNGVVRAFGLDPRVGREEQPDQEIRELVASRQLGIGHKQSLLLGVLDAEERQLRQILVPRRDVVAVREDESAAEVLDRLVAAGHSRAPVYRDALDDADRVVSALELAARPDGVVADAALDAPLLPESLSVLRALQQLQRHQRQMALVFSEHGGFEGLVTTEDLVEEIVGDLRDESDPDRRTEVLRTGNVVVVPGDLPLHALAEVGVDLEVEADATTVGGLVVERLGRLARPGDTVTVEGHRLRVEAVTKHAVERVEIRPDQ